MDFLVLYPRSFKRTWLTTSTLLLDTVHSSFFKLESGKYLFRAINYIHRQKPYSITKFKKQYCAITYGFAKSDGLFPEA